MSRKRMTDVGAGGGEISVPAAEKPLEALAAWELSIVDLFCRGAMLLGFRKSVGVVFGAIYCSAVPLSIIDLQRKLQLSRGACVEATQLLRRFGAVRLTMKIGDRRDFFEAESDLQKIASALFLEILQPGIEKLSIRLEHAEKLAVGNTAKEKISQLRVAKNALSEFVPLIENLLSRAK